MKRGWVVGLAVALVGAGCRPKQPELPVPPPAPLDRPIAVEEESTPGPVEPALVEPAPPVPGFPNADRRARLLDSVPRLETIIEGFMAADHIPGVAVGLVIDDELAWSRGFGVLDLETGVPVSADAAFRIGSITKTFTTAAILRLRDEGRLDLDDPVSQHLPLAGSFRQPTDEREGFTIRQVLVHAAGLPRTGDFHYEEPGAPGIDEAALEEAVRGLSLRGAPGLERRYSNLGFQILGLLIQEVTAEDYRAHVDRVLLEPLGMKATVWRADDAVGPLATPYDYVEGKVIALEQENHGVASAGGGLYSTVEDMARYAAFQLQAWPSRRGDDPWPLGRASLREAHRIHAFPGARIEALDDGVLGVRYGGTGLAWGVAVDCRLGHAVAHNGRNTGFTSSIVLLPRRGVGLVIMANQHATDLAELGRVVMEALAQNPALTAREVPRDPEVETRGRELFAALTGPSPASLDPWLAAGEGKEVLAQGLLDAAAALRDSHGPCTVERIEGSTELRIYGRCGRGRLRLSLSTDAEGMVSTASLVPLLRRPDPALERAAKRVERLMLGWDEALAEQTFAQSNRPSRYRPFLRSLAESHGRCTRGEIIEATPTELTQRLECERVPLRMRLTIEEAGGRVRSLSMRDDPEAGPRCLRP